MSGGHLHEDLVVTASMSLALRAARRGRAVLTPRDLCRDRGLDLARVAEGAVFFDSLLGYAILRKQDAGIVGPRKRTSDTMLSSSNFVLEMVRPQTSDPPPFFNWHIRDLGGWRTQLKGRSQRVAVMDRGIAFGLSALPRCTDHADFCSCNDLADTTNDLTGHGTQCAGVVAARVADGKAQRSVAPCAVLIAAQVARINYSPLTTLADVLLMLSWVIHRWDVRVVSMSFCASIRDEGFAGEDVLGVVACRLRQLDRALIFCAAEEGIGTLKYPASARAVVPVGPYYVDSATLKHAQVRLETVPMTSWKTWAAQDDLLFGPGSSLSTVDRNGDEDDMFGAASGACAFVAGVAALYMEAHPWRPVEKILATMQADARQFTMPGSGTHPWRAVRFPPDRRPSRLASALAPFVRRLSRCWCALRLRLCRGKRPSAP